jgi:hypothetical protein
MGVGYDKLSLNNQLLFQVSLDEYAVGATPPSYDKAKPHHTCTLHGGSWNSLPSGLPYIDLSPNPDWIECPAAATADLNFMAGDFSMVIWQSPDTIMGLRVLLCRGNGTSGWNFRNDGSSFSFATYQAAGFQESGSPSSILRPGVWSLCGISRIGTSCRLFHKGLDVTATVTNHNNPDSANLKLHIGVENNEAGNPFDGKVAGGPCSPRIWGRALSAWEHRQIWNMERDWVGV